MAEPRGDAKISERLSELDKVLQEANEVHIKFQEAGQSIEKARGKAQIVPPKPYVKNKLRALYRTGINEADKECELLRTALASISSIRQTVRLKQRRAIVWQQTGQQTGMRRGALMKMLQQTAASLPLFVPTTRGQEAPALCGAVPADSSYLAKPCDLVAAFVPGPEPEGTENWILAEVCQYIPGSAKYEVNDIDEEQKDHHTIGKKRVIPLPLMRANPTTNPEALFPKDADVFAIYPQTTCFYRGIIHSPPRTFNDDYLISFEDSTYTEGYASPLSVPQRYVISPREV